MNNGAILGRKVFKWTLPALEPGPAGKEVILKRIMLPQGELAQFHDSDEAMRYIAAIELKAGSVRGNHYHKIKREYVYVFSGEVLLVLQDIETDTRETLEIHGGDLILIHPEIIHALQVRQGGLAIEFSPQRFDANDTYRMQLV